MAVRFIRAHAAQYDIDPKRIGALGDSAGGQLAALLGTRDTRDNSDAALSSYSSKVEAVVDFYGPADFTIPLAQARLNQEAVMFLTQFFGRTPGEDPEIYRDASPVVYVDKTTAPFLILHGTADTLVPPEQSEDLYDHLQKAGAPSTLLLEYGKRHAFLNFLDPGLDLAISEQFLDEYLKH